MDESGFPLDPHSPFVLCKRGERHPAFITSGGKTQITVLACCNTAGYSIPPFVIFQGQIMKQDLTIGEVPGTMYGMSGLIVNYLMDGFKDIFLLMPQLLGHCFFYSMDIPHISIQPQLEEQQRKR